jgi:hypothetical protein
VWDSSIRIWTSLSAKANGTSNAELAANITRVPRDRTMRAGGVIVVRQVARQEGKRMRPAYASTASETACKHLQQLAMKGSGNAGTDRNRSGRRALELTARRVFLIGSSITERIGLLSSSEGVWRVSLGGTGLGHRAVEHCAARVFTEHR